MNKEKTIQLFLLIPGNLVALILACLGVLTLRTNPLGWFLFLLGEGYIAGGAIFFWQKNSTLISKTSRMILEEGGDRSFWLIVPGFAVVFLASPLEYIYLGGTERAERFLQTTGLALVMLGLAVRAWARQILKGQYSGHIQTEPNQQMQTGGPYRFVRHPGYTGYFLICLGLATGFGSILGTAALFFILLPGLYYRMNVEEKILIRGFGNAYRDYAARTKRIFPGLW